MSDSPPAIPPTRTLLLIDDQRSVLVSLEYFLGSIGYRVLCADSGPRGIALAESEQIDGALVDVHMPVMNGLDTCVRLQSQAGTLGRKLRIWFMTGAFTGDLERRSADLGALGVFRKPFNYATFSADLEHGFALPVPSAPLNAIQTSPATAELSPP